MARYIDADEAKSVIKANDWSNPVVPQVVGTIIDRIPTADVAPRAEVAREIFEEIDKRLDEITVIASPNDCFITTFRKTMEKVTAEVDELKKKYTEGEK